MLMLMKCKCKCGSQTPGVLHAPSTGGALSPHPPMPRERHDGERERTGSFFCNEVGESGVIFSLGWHGVRGGGESGPTTDQNGKKFNLI
jgi:hypothetical protein